MAQKRRTKAQFLKFYKELTGNYISVVDDVWEFFNSNKSPKQILEDDFNDE